MSPLRQCIAMLSEHRHAALTTPGPSLQTSPPYPNLLGKLLAGQAFQQSVRNRAGCR